MGGMSAEEQHEVAQEAEQHDPNHVQLEEVVEAEEPPCHSARMLQVGRQPFGWSRGRQREQEREVGWAGRKGGPPGRGQNKRWQCGEIAGVGRGGGGRSG